MLKRLIDLTGQQFGNWTVLKRASNGGNKQARWFCRCDCGKVKIVYSKDLRNGNSKGCASCHFRRIKTIHGQTGTRLYKIWEHMIRHCENPNATGYKNYGGRGISICSEWREDFRAFMNWALASGYKNNLQIDRINNNGNYESENCRFATAKEQARNRRSNRPVRIGDKVKLIVEWAEQAGLGYQVLYYRIKAGWPEHRLLKPVYSGR